MQIVSSYKVKIVGRYSEMLETLEIYRKAVRYLVPIALKHWEEIDGLSAVYQQQKIENLVHSTKNVTAVYDFDEKFYKFPTYLRRCAIRDAVGIVSSYRSSLKNYEKEKYEAVSNGRKFRKKNVTLMMGQKKFPALYRKNMFNWLTEDRAKIKVFKDNDWKWITVGLRKQDLNYIRKYCDKSKEYSPLLIKKGRNFYLQFGYEQTKNVRKTDVADMTVMSVHLGQEWSAVCSVMDSGGTVVGRRFIDQPKEKDLQIHLMNRLCKKQAQSGWFVRNCSLNDKCGNLNRHIVNDTANQVIEFALFHSVDVIVLEYLDYGPGKWKNNRQTQLQISAHRKINEKLAFMAHKNGMRYATVNGFNADRLAFDGSGAVSNVDIDKSNADDAKSQHRSVSNFAVPTANCRHVSSKICVFPNGKKYNRMLNTANNIAARFLINEILKSVSERKRSSALAKVPELGRRTCCTVSSLRDLTAVIWGISPDLCDGNTA